MEFCEEPSVFLVVEPDRALVVLLGVAVVVVAVEADFAVYFAVLLVGQSFVAGQVGFALAELFHLMGHQLGLVEVAEEEVAEVPEVV